MTDKKTLKVLLISDLHAMMDDDENKSDSFLLFNKDGESEFINGFEKFITENDLAPDVITCAGDVSNKGCIEAFTKAWERLARLKSSLNSDILLCVPGNHDHDSRLVKNNFDPKYHLQFLSPKFPSEKDEENTRFWAWHWCHIEQPDFNAILLNTSAYHGYSKEFKHGRIAPKISEQIKDYLQSDKFVEKKINFVVCHHHPCRMEYVGDGSDYEAIDGGSNFIHHLSAVDKGPWMFLHGHKHWPNISRTNTGTTTAPFIVSAGSLSAEIYDEIKELVSNLFCFIEFDLDRTEQTGIPSGTIKAYEWNKGYGWSKSTNKYMPHVGGFGSTGIPRKLARDIRDKLSEKEQFIHLDEITDIRNELKFFTPHDIRLLKNELDKFGVEVEINEYGQFDQFGLKNDA